MKKEKKIKEKKVKVKKPRKRLGDRRDGRRVRTLPPMMYITPFVMKDRCDAQNYFKSSVDMDIIEEYLRDKKKDYKGLGFMHIMAAAYVRLISQKPALNRFIAGQRIYKRDDIRLCMVVKKSMDLNAQESIIKVIFDPKDTIYDVYNKMEEKIAVAKQAGDSNGFDRVARMFFALPALVFRGFMKILRFMDYFGIMPKFIDNASPFHASFFISNLGSLGIPPIYHHIYNFGNLPVFITFGSIHRQKVRNADGTETVKKYLDYTAVVDERITDGHYYATAFKEMDYILKHPSELDTPPATVVEDIK